MLNIVEIQKNLLSCAQPSGFERKTGELIAKLIKPYADEVYFDVLGNLIAKKKGTGKGNKVMLAAHMDTIGIMVTGIDDKGYISFDTLGGFMYQRLFGTKFKFNNGTVGVVGKENDDKEMRMSNLYLDIGAKDKTDAEKLVAVGDIAIFEGGMFMVANNNIMGPYMDDLIGCSILICALSEIKNNVNDLYFVFTVQEEVGIRGAKTSAYSIDADWGFCVDVTGTGDYPEANKPLMPITLGKGAAIKIKDGSLICNKEIVTLLKDAATLNNIPFQLEILRYGGTDSGAIQTTKGGILAGGISVPTRYIHSPSEMCSLDDIENCVKLIIEAVKTVL